MSNDRRKRWAEWIENVVKAGFVDGATVSALDEPVKRMLAMQGQMTALRLSCEMQHAQPVPARAARSRHLLLRDLLQSALQLAEDAIAEVEEGVAESQDRHVVEQLQLRLRNWQPDREH